MEPDLPLPPRPALGRALRAWRQARRVKQGHAAELLHVSQATISRWESGRQSPSAREAARLREMLGATPDGAADAALLQLVVSSRLPVHLICDATHRLLAASRPRAQAWQVSPESLYGLSLWRYASEDIQHAERQLADLGWYEPAAAPVILSTGANRYAEVPIRPSQVRWTRLRLSDGSYARLVETMHSGSEPE